MIPLVVDSSVVIKWSVPEVHSADALLFLDPDLGRHAPELLLAEVSNILWKKVGRGELMHAEAESIADDLGRADIVIHPMGPLFGAALRIALETGRSAYDSMYLALGRVALDAHGHGRSTALQRPAGRALRRSRPLGRRRALSARIVHPSPVVERYRRVR